MAVVTPEMKNLASALSEGQNVLGELLRRRCGVPEERG